MIRTLLSATIVLFGLGAASASASDRCHVPTAEWQPREALQQKLEAAGWKVNRLETDSGCYEAYAIDPDGRRIEAYFDPKTLEIVKKKIDD